MKRNSDLSIRFPAYYRHDLMDKQRVKLGLSLNEVSRRAGVPLESTCRVFLGKAGNKKVWPIAELLKMDWSQLHNFDLKETEFHLALVSNGRKQAG